MTFTENEKPKGEKCRSCGATVIWAWHEKSRKFLIIEAHQQGNMVLKKQQELFAVDKSIGYRVEIVSPRQGQFQSHFVSFPQREKWRRR